MQFVYFIVFGSRRRITFGITMCAFAVKTSTESPQTVADESATNECVADKDVADKDVAGASIMPARRFRRPTVRQVQFVYFIVFRAGRRITFGITMCAFAVKTSAESPQTVADESATNEGVADKDVADEGVVPARRFRRPRIRQVQFVYFIVFGSRRRITFGAMDRAPAGKRKRGAVSAPIRRSWEPLHGNCPAPLSPCSQYASRT